MSLVRRFKTDEWTRTQHLNCGKLGAQATDDMKWLAKHKLKGAIEDIICYDEETVQDIFLKDVALKIEFDGEFYEDK